MQAKFRLESIKRYLLIAAVPAFLFCLSYCGSEKNTLSIDSGYLNWNDTVGYVGMQTCRQCHSQIYDDYIQTGMGRSFDHSSVKKSAAAYGPHQLVYDEATDYWYRPYWRNDSLRILEFRMEGQDTIHRREETVRYIIGSGQHTNSHLIDRNGYVYQAPITYYTQEGKWDMAPGFENGFNSRFSRMIEEECMSCHNGLPDLKQGSVNRYEFVPNGIDCERCHGPGEVHIAQKSLGILVDTATAIDYSIVNPGKLSVDAQLDLCQRCHLQGVAVLNDGASWDSYKPGMSLKDHWNIFLPRQEAESERFLMASQAERLRKSKCYIESGAISCISCHNPHLSVTSTPVARFNQPCLTCHEGGDDCTESTLLRQKSEDNCGSCHMPSSGSIDIPHVSITDHRIQIPGRANGSDGAAEESEQIANRDAISGLVCLTDPQAGPLTMANGYLKFYEAFNANEEWLDSARAYLQAAVIGEDLSREEKMETSVHLAFLEKNDEELIKLAASFPPETVKSGWTAYRLAEGFFRRGDRAKERDYLLRAVSLEPLNLDFCYKLGNAYAALNQASLAAEQYSFILKEQPGHASALSNLGFLRLQAGATEIAEDYFNKALASDPDHLKAQLNLTQLYFFTGRTNEGKKLLGKLQKKFPEEAEVKLLIERTEI